MTRTRFCVAFAAILWTLPVIAAEWRAGTARVEITPNEPVWMAGYASRKHASEGAIHPLWAKVLVLEDAQRGERAVIVTSDMIGMTRELADAVAARVLEQTKIPRERIVFSASHTHCGPLVRRSAVFAYNLDAEPTAAVERYTAALPEKIASAIVDAAGALHPASLDYGEGQAAFGMNRRTLRDGRFVIAPNPAGPVDHSVPVLRVSDAEGKPLAVLFGYACHNTTLGGVFYRFNGDYAGFAQIELERAQAGVQAMFMIGCGADTNPEPRGTLALAEEHGRALAAAVQEALAGKMHAVAGPLAVAFTRVELPLVAPPTKTDLEARRGQGDAYQQRLTESLLARLEEGRALDEACPCPVQVIRFGRDLSLVALGGEVVVDYAVRLKQELKDERLWVAGYANEVFAYVPSERVLAEGGYEAGGAMVYFGWHGPFQPGVEDRLIGTVRQLLDETRTPTSR